MGLSVADTIASLPEPEQTSWWLSLPAKVKAELALLPWWFVRRPEQACPDGDWFVWLILTGRGWGKTRTGAETLLDWIEAFPVAPDGSPTEWLVIAETFGDCRKICVQGPSGLRRVLRRRGYRQVREITGAEHEFVYSKSDWQITLSTGQVIHMAGADDADAGRGLNLAGLWADELAKWRYPSETWLEGLVPSLRIGRKPRAIVTTTPKPIEILRQWTASRDGSVHVTSGSTFDNAVNLSRRALAEMRRRYGGSRVGRQELLGELLMDVEGALWQRAQIDADRVTQAPVLVQTVVAVDPAVTSGDKADYTGIIVIGKGVDGDAYMLADRTRRDTPLRWAQEIVRCYHAWDANLIVIETNNGGDALADLIRTVENVPIKQITAKKGKRVRAEPVSALSEQHRVHMVGTFPDLEDQLCTWTPEQVESPDRMDAFVYGVLELLASGGKALDYLTSLVPACPACGNPAGPDHSCFLSILAAGGAV